MIEEGSLFTFLIFTLLCHFEHEFNLSLLEILNEIPFFDLGFVCFFSGLEYQDNVAGRREAGRHLRSKEAILTQQDLSGGCKCLFLIDVEMADDLSLLLPFTGRNPFTAGNSHTFLVFCR